MSNDRVLDFLFIKDAERKIGRKFTEEELEMARFGEEIFITDRFTKYWSFKVPTYQMPYDLISKEADIREIQVIDARKSGQFNPIDREFTKDITFYAGGDQNTGSRKLSNHE